MAAAVCNANLTTNFSGGNCNAFSNPSQHIQTSRRAKWRAYSTETVRWKSFDAAPPELRSQSHNLARLGFYYKGYRDTIVCFHCGLELHGTGTDYYTEHLTRAPDCEYILSLSSSQSEESDVEENVTSDDIMITSPTDMDISERLNGVSTATFEDHSQMQDSREQNSVVTVPDPELTREIAEVRGEILEIETRLQCKVCLSDRVSVTFSPCGHLVTCQTCAARLHKCPLCRAFIRKKINTFLS